MFSFSVVTSELTIGLEEQSTKPSFGLFVASQLLSYIFETHKSFAGTQYNDIVQALRRGDIRLLRYALQANEDQCVT